MVSSFQQFIYVKKCMSAFVINGILAALPLSFSLSNNVYGNGKGVWRFTYLKKRSCRIPHENEKAWTGQTRQFLKHNAN
jgi:hypothetical protein